MNGDINQIIQQLTMFYDNKKNPQFIMQNIMQNNGTEQVNQMKTQLVNMANGKNPKQFILEIAKQNGATIENLQNLARIMG